VRIWRSAIVDRVTNILSERRGAITVEHIQDLVEQQLMAAGQFEAAKTYILYREQRKQFRDAEPAGRARRRRRAREPDVLSDRSAEAPVLRQVRRVERAVRAAARRCQSPSTACSTFLQVAAIRLPTPPRSSAWSTTSANAMLEQRAFPSMRVFQMAGPALDALQRWRLQLRLHRHRSHHCVQRAAVRADAGLPASASRWRPSTSRSSRASSDRSPAAASRRRTGSFPTQPRVGATR
jgi:hypothetical protein